MKYFVDDRQVVVQHEQQAERFHAGKLVEVEVIMMVMVMRMMMMMMMMMMMI